MLNLFIGRRHVEIVLKAEPMGKESDGYGFSGCDLRLCVRVIDCGAKPVNGTNEQEYVFNSDWREECHVKLTFSPCAEQEDGITSDA